jgi:hypothetical protein
LDDSSLRESSCFSFFRPDIRTNAHIEADLIESQERKIAFDFPLHLEDVYVMQVRSGCGNPTWNRNVHRDLPDLLDQVIGHMSTTGVTGHDGCHFFNHSYVEWGERIARLIHRDLYGAGYGNNIETPDPISASWLSSTELQIEFGETGNGRVLESGSDAFFSLLDGVGISMAQVVGSAVVLTDFGSQSSHTGILCG